MSENNEIKLLKDKDHKEFNIHKIIVLWLFVATSTITIILTMVLIYSHMTGKELLSILPVVIIAGVFPLLINSNLYAAKPSASFIVPKLCIALVKTILFVLCCDVAVMLVKIASIKNMKFFMIVNFVRN